MKSRYYEFIILVKEETKIGFQKINPIQYPVKNYLVNGLQFPKWNHDEFCFVARIENTLSWFHSNHKIKI